MEQLFKIYRTSIEKGEGENSYINLDYLYKYKNLLTVKAGSSIRLKFSDKELKDFLDDIKNLKEIDVICDKEFGASLKNSIINLTFRVKKIQDNTIDVTLTLGVNSWEFNINPWNINEGTVSRDASVGVASHRSQIEHFIKSTKNLFGYITNEKGKRKFIDEYYYDFINNKLYAKDKYVKISNKYYLKSSDVLATDIRTGKLELKRNLTALIADIIDKKPVFVYTSDKTTQLPIYISRETLKSYGEIPNFNCGDNLNVIYCSDYKVASKLGFIEDFHYGVFKEHDKINLENVESSPKYKPFNFTKSKKDFKTKYEGAAYGVSSFTNLVNQGKDYTFGIELETSHGYMPSYAAKDLNLRCVRDGSIAGGEYVTGVLTGDHGLEHLSKITSQLIKRCGVDKTCGMHVHIGNAKFNKEFIVLAYILGTKIEESMSSILPKSRLGNHYCRQLEQSVIKGYKTAFKDISNKGNVNYDDYKLFIDTYYEVLYNYYLAGGGMLGKTYNKKKDHPGKRWNTTRYFWLNLQPCMFATADSEGVVKTIKEVHNVKKGITIDRINPDYLNIEFRNHSGTLSFNKIKNWLLICKAFVYYVENNKLDILNKPSITLEDLVCNAYTDKDKPKYYLRSTLLDYIKQRREKFINFDEDYRAEVNETQIPNNVKEMMSDEKQYVESKVQMETPIPTIKKPSKRSNFFLDDDTSEYDFT